MLTIPRGFRKTTVAGIVSNASEGLILHVQKGDLKGHLQKLSFGAVPGQATVKEVDIPVEPVLIAAGEYLRSKSFSSAILDDITGNAEVSKSGLTNFVEGLPRIAPGKHLVIITSNEGFLKCMDDTAKANGYVRVLPFQAASIPELTSALQDALLTRRLRQTAEAFTDVPKEITENLLTADLVAEVAEQLPLRHGRSMRVWGSLLTHTQLSAAGLPRTTEGLRAALARAVRSPAFLLDVTKNIDLNVFTLNKVHGLLSSSPMTKEELGKV